MRPTRLQLVHDPTLDLDGRILERTAVRAVLRRGSELLLVRTSSGEYGFAGGGVAPGEGMGAAVRRELLEECGVDGIVVEGEVLTIVEFRAAREPDVDVFVMTSHYFDCSGQVVRGDQQLEAYELAMGLAPVWVEPHRAIAANEAICAREPAPPHWVVRDLLALQTLATTWDVIPG